MKIFQLLLKRAKNSSFLQQTWKESKRFADSVFSCSFRKSKNIEKISDVSLPENASPKTKQLFNTAIKKIDTDIGDGIPFDLLELEARSIKFKKSKVLMKLSMLHLGKIHKG